MNHLPKKPDFAHMALALSLIIGTFSLFSITFGLQKNNSYSSPSELFYTNREDQIINKPEKPIIEKFVSAFSFGTQEIASPKEEPAPEQRYVLQQLKQLGSIQAQSFLVGDLDTGEIIFERKPNTTYPIASITKYMTAYTAAQTMGPNELATITQKKLQVEGNRGGFRAGDKLTIRELLYPLLLVSSNDAGEIIAQNKNRDGFVAAMKENAIGLQMTNTSFEDPTGLSRNNISTARDLFALMQGTLRNYPQIIDISRLSFKQNGKYTWRNINKASRFEEFRGGKTGYTNAARQTSIGYYQIKLANDEYKNIAIVILQSNTRQQDTRNILDYIKKYVSYL